MKVHRTLLMTGLALTLALTVGCSKPNLITINYDAVDSLLGNTDGRLPDDARILTGTFVDLDNTTSTSSFGRLSGELCGARLSQKGHEVVNVKLRKKSVAIIQGWGEALLSRDVTELGEEFNSNVVLVGTYTRTRPSMPSTSFVLPTVADDEADDDSPAEKPERLYVSLRLIATEDNSTIAATDYCMPVDAEVAWLLKQSSANMGDGLAGSQWGGY